LQKKRPLGWQRVTRQKKKQPRPVGPLGNCNPRKTQKSLSHITKAQHKSERTQRVLVRQGHSFISIRISVLTVSWYKTEKMTKRSIKATSFNTTKVKKKANPCTKVRSLKRAMFRSVEDTKAKPSGKNNQKTRSLAILGG